ncbi:hypothetical protein FGB62_2g06 [Gracilaria domingensis]|nr:hypothetical protein FGB62_2g06 [Gracilaria domingensis]
MGEGSRRDQIESANRGMDRRQRGLARRITDALPVATCHAWQSTRMPPPYFSSSTASPRSGPPCLQLRSAREAAAKEAAEEAHAAFDEVAGRLLAASVAATNSTSRFPRSAPAASSPQLGSRSHE